MKRLILVAVFLFSASAIHAEPYNVSTAQTFQTSAGAIRVQATGQITKAQGKLLLLRGLGGTAAKGIWRIAAGSTAIIGALFLAVDLYNMVQDLRGNSDVESTADVDLTLNNCENCGTAWIHTIGGPYTYTNVNPASTTQLYTAFQVTMSGYSIIITENGSAMYPVGTRYKTVRTKNSGTNSDQHQYNVPLNYNVTYTNNSPYSYTKTGGEKVIDEDALDDYLDANAHKLADASYAAPSIEPGPVAGDPLPLGDAPGTIVEAPPSTGPDAGTDPRTGESTEPVEDPNDVTDVYSQPNQPGIFEPNTDIELPEQKDIKSAALDFLDNAPFMNVINNFEVDASSGSSSLTFTAFGKTVDWDFNQYHNIYASMAAIIIALAYIWSAQIIFGGRA